MGQNYYSEINLDLTWHTIESTPVLKGDVETLTHRSLRCKALEIEGVLVHEVGGTDTHVHMAVSIPPTLTISQWIGQLKGATSHEVNQRLGLRQKVLQWQAGYGVVSFGTKDLPWVRRYIQNQRQHHLSGTAVDRLERVDRNDDGAEAEDREVP